MIRWVDKKRAAQFEGDSLQRIYFLCLFLMNFPFPDANFYVQPVFIRFVKWCFANFSRQWNFINVFFKKRFNLFELILLFFRNKVIDILGAGTSCTAYAVHIIFSIVWNIVVDNKRNIVDIDAAETTSVATNILTRLF